MSRREGGFVRWGTRARARSVAIPPLCGQTKSRSTWVIRGRHGRLCRDRPLLSSVWHSGSRPFPNERPVLTSPSSPSTQWPVRVKNSQAPGPRVQCMPECFQCRDWSTSSNHRAGGWGRRETGQLMIVNCTWFAVIKKKSKCWWAKDTDVIMGSVNERLGLQRL